jgi:SAM-dependent methyltransferase
VKRDQLRAFYDGQLEHQPDVALIPTVRRPSNRFEACIRWFPEYFQRGRILELGAGSTLVARSLLAAGVRADSIVIGEYSPQRLRHIESTIDDERLSVDHIDAEDLPAGLGQFDAVLMVAVIEHLIDPMTAMERIRTLLRPGGFVWINTPNIAKWTRRAKLLLGRFPSTAAWDEGLLTYGRSPARLLDEGHLHYFTFRSLTRMLVERCGYSAVVPVPHCESPRFSLPIEHALARALPTMFSEVSVVAYG